MKTFPDKVFNLPHPYLTEPELEILLGGTPNSRYSKIKRLIRQNKLLHIRRGLYCLTEMSPFHIQPHPYELAQYIYAPSYVSMESALSYHQLIPEAVYTVTSACIKRSKKFHTALGLFDYIHFPLENFYTEVELINEGRRSFFMATPWKAICDYIYHYKKKWTSVEPLIQSLRISPEDLPILTDNVAASLDEYYHRRHLSDFLKNVCKG